MVPSTLMLARDFVFFVLFVLLSFDFLFFLNEIERSKRCRGGVYPLPPGIAPSPA